MFEEISTEVSTEPILQPLTGEKLPSGSNVSEEARLYIRTRGFWQRYEMSFFAVKGFKPICQFKSKPEALNYICKRWEGDNQRIIQVKHSSSTPLVWVPTVYNNPNGKKTTKRDMPSSVIANYVWKKISFSLVKSLVNCVRQTRTRNGENPINSNNVEIRDTCIGILKIAFLHVFIDLLTYIHI